MGGEAPILIRYVWSTRDKAEHESITYSKDRISFNRREYNTGKFIEKYFPIPGKRTCQCHRLLLAELGLKNRPLAKSVLTTRQLLALER